jgi:glycosyltransferase involved in cell wall biosynthesis
MCEKSVVTIGLCTRNEEHTIQHTLDSIASQDFPHKLIELIVVDDSDDSTFSIIKEYVSKMDFKVKVFKGYRKGLAFARNIVIENAEGEYLLWVDGDIIIPPDHVRKQVQFMEQHPEVGIAKASFHPLPQKGVVPTLENLEWVAVDYIIKSGGANVPSYLSGGSVHRVKALKQIGGYDTNIVGAGEDEEIEWRMSNSGWKVHFGTEACYYEWRKQTWKALWDNYFWYGYGAYYLYNKGVRTVKFSTLIGGFLLSRVAYQVTGKKLSFLLPIQYYFKRVAWFLGLAKAYLSGHKNGKN